MTMQSSTVEEIVAGLKAAEITFCAYLPDEWLVPLINRVLADPYFQVIPVANEGEGVAMCAGSWLGGRRAVMMMENSGIRVACEELARLGLAQGVPVFMLMPYRGDLGDMPAWAQSTGFTMEPILNALTIGYRVVRREDEVQEAIRRAPITMAASKNHVAVIFGAELCDPLEPAHAAD